MNATIYQSCWCWILLQLRLISSLFGYSGTNSQHMKVRTRSSLYTKKANTEVRPVQFSQFILEIKYIIYALHNSSPWLVLYHFIYLFIYLISSSSTVIYYTSVFYSDNIIILSHQYIIYIYIYTQISVICNNILHILLYIIYWIILKI